ncbi:hypothetical protein ABLE68_16530 [Nocardioides sp. CN2-186]|uniref:hypothetical protein n=1 Tax=Nocardioides tweenelious TaxID=3156607 RepID=UPI0032B58C82
MIRYVDHDTDGTPVGRVVVLPGRRYTPDGPMLFFAAQTALARGWDVRQVWWEAPAFDNDDDEVTWVCDQLAAAVDGYDGRVLVVAKSLGTLAAPLAAERGYQAAWLTPLLTEPDMAEVLLGYPAEQYVVIGDADPYLDRDVLDRLPGETQLVPGDHILRVGDDPAAMVASHERFVTTFSSWLAGASRG